jgi:hypothetical protein
VENRNDLLLQDFTNYCRAHPGERFWQALRNWCGSPFILATLELPDNAQFQDTFYWTEKDA